MLEIGTIRIESKDSAKVVQPQYHDFSHLKNKYLEKGLMLFVDYAISEAALFSKTTTYRALVPCFLRVASPLNCNGNAVSKRNKIATNLGNIR